MKHHSCDSLLLYENVPARVGEARTIEENRLQDALPYAKRGDIKTNELTLILCPNHPLTNLKSADWVSIPWGVRPNTASYVPGLSTLGPNIWINTPTGRELLTWCCTSDGGCSYEGAIRIYQNGEKWYMSYDNIEFCFENSNFVCSAFPEGYSFKESTGPRANFKILRIQEKQDHLGNTSHYNIFCELFDQDGICIQQ